MPRFVLLEHDHPTLHWDLMLEVGAVLWTWRLDAIPRPGTPCGAVCIPDHRPLYLDYEGPISGDRGRATQVAAGEFAWVEQSPGRIVIELRGVNLSGRATIEGENLLLVPFE